MGVLANGIACFAGSVNEDTKRYVECNIIQYTIPLCLSDTSQRGKDQLQLVDLEYRARRGEASGFCAISDKRCFCKREALRKSEGLSVFFRLLFPVEMVAVTVTVV